MTLIHSVKAKLLGTKFKKMVTKQFGDISVDTKLDRDTITPGDVLEDKVELSSKKWYPK
jgi:hypothetical protein